MENLNFRTKAKLPTHSITRQPFFQLCAQHFYRHTKWCVFTQPDPNLVSSHFLTEGPRPRASEARGMCSRCTCHESSLRILPDSEAPAQAGNLPPSTHPSIHRLWVPALRAAAAPWAPTLHPRECHACPGCNTEDTFIPHTALSTGRKAVCTTPRVKSLVSTRYVIENLAQNHKKVPKETNLMVFPKQQTPSSVKPAPAERAHNADLTAILNKQDRTQVSSRQSNFTGQTAQFISHEELKGEQEHCGNYTPPGNSVPEPV